nr:site-specific integrase [Haloechinothrix aidingensis]
MLTELDGTDEWLPVALAVFAGLRVHEIARVEPQHVERDDEGYVLRMRGKGSSEWRVPIPPELARRLRALPPDAPAVRGRYGRGYTVDGLSHAISRIMREHDVPGSAHSLRHLYGTRVHRQTRDLLATQRLMRHASPSTTSGYAAMDVTALRDATEAVWHDLGTDQEGPRDAGD